MSRPSNDQGESQLPWMRGAKRQRQPSPRGKGGSKSGGKGSSKDKDKGGMLKSKIGHLASKTKGGNKLCGSFSSRRGCRSSESNCPQWASHACGYILSDDGKVCNARDHGFSDHGRKR